LKLKVILDSAEIYGTLTTGQAQIPEICNGYPVTSSTRDGKGSWSRDRRWKLRP